MAKALFIGRLQQARPKGFVDFDSGPDNISGQGINIHKSNFTAETRRAQRKFSFSKIGRYRFLKTISGLRPQDMVANKGFSAEGCGVF